MFCLHRRSWLKGIGIGLVVGLGEGFPLPAADSAKPIALFSFQPGGDTAGSDRPKRRFRSALHCSALGIPADQQQAIQYAKRFGFEAVEPLPDYLRRLSEAQLADLRQQLQQAGLVWSAANLPVQFRESEEQFATGLKALPEYARALQQAGVQRMGTYLRPCHPDRTYLENFRLHVRRLRAVAEVLGEHGFRLGLEYVGPKTSWTAARFPFIHTMREMKELVAEINHPAVGLLLDSWHWYTAGETVEDILRLRGGEVVLVHLNDAPAGVPAAEQVDSVRQLPLATGVIDLKGFLGALVKIGFDGPALIEPFYRPLREMPPEKALALAAEAMRKCLALVEESR